MQSNSAALDCCRAMLGTNAAQHCLHAQCTITCQIACCSLSSFGRARAFAVLSRRGATNRITYSKLICVSVQALLSQSLCAQCRQHGVGNFEDACQECKVRNIREEPVRMRVSTSERFKMDLAHHARASELLNYCAIWRHRFWQLRCEVLYTDVHLYLTASWRTCCFIITGQVPGARRTVGAGLTTDTRP